MCDGVAFTVCNVSRRFVVCWVVGPCVSPPVGVSVCLYVVLMDSRFVRVCISVFACVGVSVCLRVGSVWFCSLWCGVGWFCLVQCDSLPTGARRCGPVTFGVVC